MSYLSVFDAWRNIIKLEMIKNGSIDITFSKLTATALFAISQVEDMHDEPILFERPEIGSPDASLEPNVTYPGDACC